MAKIDPVRLSHIQDHITKGEYDIAKKKCKKHFNNRKFVMCYLKVLLLENNFKEAEELCLKHLDDNTILSQYILILCKTNRYEEAKDYCERNNDIEEIMPGYIQALSHFDEIDKIKEIGERYPYNRFICRSCAVALMKNGLYFDALKVCDKHKYDSGILDIRNTILKIMKDENDYSSTNDLYYISTKIKKLIGDGNLNEAKSLCKKNIDSPGIFELYILIIEKERKNDKKYSLKLED